MRKLRTRKQRRSAETEKAKYDRHIHSPKWKRFKASILATRGKRCEDCFTDGPVDLHHLHYRNFGKELAADVLLLCRSCHDKRHA